jgi:hypothetical protein
MGRTASTSALVHRLFLISSDVIFTSRPCADDADDLFAMEILPIHVSEDQNRVDVLPNRYRTDRMSALLTALIHAIDSDLTVLILKNKRRHFEADSVFALILAVLPFIPPVAHLYTHAVAQLRDIAKRAVRVGISSSLG